MLILGSWSLSAVGFLVLSVALLLWVVLTRLVCKSERSRGIAGNAGVVIFTICYMLLIAEFLFSVFVVQSNSLGGTTLAGRRWGEKYWLTTINSYGYRDPEPVWSDHALFVIGSSFAAGGGIERLEDRMSAVLNRKLGPRWTVATLAQAGWNSRQKYDALLAFPKTPDIIVVTDFLNSIDEVAAKHGLIRPSGAAPSPFLKPFVDNSSLVNWIYFRLPDPTAFEKYWSYLNSAFASPEIFADYVGELAKFTSYAEKINAQLYFVISPMLSNVDGSDDLIRRVSEVLKARGAKIIDLSPNLKNRPVGELVVHSSDMHPNARVHAELAEVIFDRLAKEGLPGASTRPFADPETDRGR